MDKRVTKEEFIDFINNYPNPLIRDVCGISDPPLITYNDFTLGYFPKSIVARTWAYSDIKGDIYYEPEEERSYFINEVN